MRILRLGLGLGLVFSVDGKAYREIIFVEGRVRKMAMGSILVEYLMNFLVRCCHSSLDR